MFLSLCLYQPLPAPYSMELYTFLTGVFHGERVVAKGLKDRRTWVEIFRLVEWSFAEQYISKQTLIVIPGCSGREDASDGGDCNRQCREDEGGTERRRESAPPWEKGVVERVKRRLLIRLIVLTNQTLRTEISLPSSISVPARLASFLSLSLSLCVSLPCSLSIFPAVQIITSSQARLTVEASLRAYERGQ